MKKHLICVLIIALILTLCSCGVDPKAEDTQPAPDTAAPAAQSQGLEFQSNGDGTCTLVGIGSYDEKDLEISGTSPNGDTITAIGEFAFAGCETIESVTFDHAQLTVGDNAFTENRNLKELVINDSTITLGTFAFSTSGLETVEIENSNVTVKNNVFFDSDLDGFFALDSTLEFRKESFTVGPIQTLKLTDCDVTVEEAAFEYCEDLASVIVKGGTLEIDDCGFYGCENLTELTLLCEVSAGKQAFASCASLTSVEFGDEKVELGDEAFQFCELLESVTFDTSDVELGRDVFYLCSENLVIYQDGKEFNSDLEEILPVVEKVYTIDDLTITLTDDFEEYDVEQGDYALVSDRVGIVFFKEEYTKFTDAGMDLNEFTLTQFAQAVISVNELGDIEVQEKDGITYFIVEIDSFKYYICVFQGTDAYWRINFYTYTESFEEMLPQFEQWASGVTFG